MTDDDPRLRPVAEELLARDCAEAGVVWTWDGINEVHQLKLLADARILLAVADGFDPLRKGGKMLDRDVGEAAK